MTANRIIFILILSLIKIIISPSERHLVEDLFNGLYSGEIYSGYLNTDVEGTELFYIFTPSQSDPKKDPVLLWLNGGPICSPLTAFLELIGPVKFVPYQKEPILNEYSWNKNASILYIDSPGGVGFSKLENPKFFYNDTIHAVSLNIAIQNFFKVFIEYQGNNFYIAGESYAGTYIPHLVTQMFKYMDENKDAIQLNLKGFLIGNPYIFEDTDWEDSMFDFSFSHALISPETYEKYLNECPHWPQIEKIYQPYEEKDDYKYEPIINKDELQPYRNVTSACNEARNETKSALDGINFYGILNECPSEDAVFELKKGFTNIDYEESNLHSEENVFKRILQEKIDEKYRRYTGRKLLSGENAEEETELAIDFFPPSCKETKYTVNFLNDNTTKVKLGVNTSMIFSKCFSGVNYKMGDSFSFFKNDIKKFYNKKRFSSWLFSGTEDMACTTLGNLRMINELNYEVKEDWKKWKKWKVDGQVTGMEQTYDYGLKFITVKNAGNSVIGDQPKASWVIYQNFLKFHKTKIEPNTKHLVDDLFDGLYKKEIYSGYLTTKYPDIELFYTFTPSQSDPKKDPIILWLNGGPGCSSMAGFLEIIGPVKFIPYQKKPVLNEYAWNKNASIFYIESLGGVGFSTLENLKFPYNDTNQAEILNIAIQNFFKVFPEYQKNIFLIAGESYAGTYIPHLVTQMFKYMDENKDAIQLNLKGFLIGNPYIFEDTDWEDSMFDFSFSHALISPETYEKYLNECPHWPQIEKIYQPYEEKDDYKYEPIINKDELQPYRNVTSACNEARNETKSALDGINFYGILNECPSEDAVFELKKGFTNIDYEESSLHSEEYAFRRMLNKNINEKYRRYTGRRLLSEENDEIETEKAIDFFPSCKGNLYTENFLNNNTIKEKLGVDATVIHKNCNFGLNYKWGDSIDYFKNDIKELFNKKKFSSWIFSGTEDMACVTIGNLRMINELNYTVKETWKKWKVDGQVAGMEQTYDYGLKFITVKGAGHKVSEDKPKIGKVILDNFIGYITKETEPDDEKKESEDSFPVWAIAVIAGVGLLIIVIIIFVVVKTKKKISNRDIEETGKLLTDFNDK